MSYCIVQRPRANFITYEYKDTRVFVTPAYDYEVFFFTPLAASGI